MIHQSNKEDGYELKFIKKACRLFLSSAVIPAVIKGRAIGFILPKLNYRKKRSVQAKISVSLQPGYI